MFSSGKVSGIYFSLNMGFWLVWEKYDDLLVKKANIVGKGVEKREYFHCTWGKKYDLGKRGGAKISNFWEIYTPG